MKIEIISKKTFLLKIEDKIHELDENEFTLLFNKMKEMVEKYNIGFILPSERD